MTAKTIAIVLILLAGIVVLLLRPADRGQPYTSYFDHLNQQLKAAGAGMPTLVLDLDRLDQNIDLVRATIQPPMRYRVVAKSLPSIPLLKHVMDRAGTRAAMVFHGPFITQLALAVPDVDLLLGKPMPVQAAEAVYASGLTEQGFDPAVQLQWLIDSDERLRQYQELAARLGIQLRINIEIDVGLHRGGLASPAELLPMLERIANDSNLNFSGFMGYDAHIASAPPVISSIDRALGDVVQRYRSFVEAGEKAFPDLFAGPLTFNGAGSKTYMLYQAEHGLNDLSMGSGLVKPTDFDVDTLRAHKPALYIATPVLKRLNGTKIPFIEALSPLFSWWDRNQQLTYFTYGGGWLARYTAPEGLQDNGIYGFSTNQAIVNGSRATNLSVDDHIFMRPTQSEHVMLQFGDLTVVRDGKIVDRWPVFRQ